jgi:hypothetical protein
MKSLTAGKNKKNLYEDIEWQAKKIAAERGEKVDFSSHSKEDIGLDFGATKASEFTGSDAEAEQLRGENLRQTALKKLQEKRDLLKKSAIFGKSKESDHGDSDDKIDLTKEDDSMTELKSSQLTDFDLLDATLDPNDIKSMVKVRQLEEELEVEKVRIQAKFLYKYAFREDNPLRINE